MNVIEPEDMDSAAVKIAIVASRFNSPVVDRLYSGAMECFRENSINENGLTLVKVPGAFEIPIAAKGLLDKNQYDAIVTLGAIIRGETPHFEFIANECTHGLARLALASDVPVIFGVLTVDNIDQAMDRAGDGESNKGYEAASAALEMIGVLKKIKS